MNKKLTLKDIAGLAGVSLSTASAYINDKAKKYRISQNTCDRLEAIIKKYNFQPNTHARAIAGKKTLLIGVILAGEINSSFWMDILSGIETTIAPTGYHILLSVAYKSNAETLKAFDFTINKGVDGIIFASLFQDKTKIKYLNELYSQKAMVSITNLTPGIPSACNDNASGGKATAEYLYSAGHRKIAYIGVNNYPDKRDVAFCDHLSTYGIKVEQFKSATAFSHRITEFTATACISDYHAMLVYKVASEQNISIPDDLSVVGFDNMDFTALMHPSLTTVNQSKKELGVLAAEMIMQQINNKEKSIENKFFASELIIRDSVKILEPNN
jgi:LacI family transcriptional regulator, galactose operon repressor